ETEKEKAQLANEILQSFTPCMENSAAVVDKVNKLTENLRSVTDLFSDLSEDKSKIFLEFLKVYTSTVSDLTINSKMIFEFYQLLLNKTSGLIDEFEKAAQR
ncbi:MAG TPA: hypothetical protein VKR58_13335, partial [Aquella sp.]|nr:hypothetical protein [Aquella sp.]